jgi:abortive infection bacteriophage resistance protein
VSIITIFQFILKDIDFENVIQIYEFDRELRTLLFSVIGEIEIYLRHRISHYHFQKYGGLGYLEQKNFNDIHNHFEFLGRIENNA